jgi:hypothetical protein
VPDGWRVVELGIRRPTSRDGSRRTSSLLFPEGAPMPVIAFDELNDVVTA